MVKFMNTIKDKKTFTLEIKKSKFIAIIRPILSEMDAKNVIDSIKCEYKGAKHYTYAYITNGIMRFSDDKEPTGTAGSPILNILLTSDMNNVIIVVVRYFGGILLGVGGLARAYLNAAKGALNECELIPYVSFKKYMIKFKYEDEKNVNYLLKDALIYDKKYEEVIIYYVEIPIYFDLNILKNYEIKEVF